MFMSLGFSLPLTLHPLALPSIIFGTVTYITAQALVNNNIDKNNVKKIYLVRDIISSHIDKLPFTKSAYSS